MKIQKIEADSWQQAIRLVKEQMGPNALILSTRRMTRKGGALGLFGRPFIEVTAALEDREDREKRSREGRRSSSPEEASPPPGEEDPLRKEIEELRLSLANLRRSFRENQADNARREDYFQGASLLASRSETLKHPVLFELAQELKGQGVERILIQECVGQIGSSLSEAQLQVPGCARNYLAALLLKLVPIGGPLQVGDGGPKAVAFVGPTGVGKTTTVAKLASHFSLLEKKQVALLTIDTFRAAAAEQLQTYSRLLGIPLDVALGPAALKKLLEKHEDKDLILIDTAGGSQRNQEHLRDLASFFQGRHTIETHLLLSATTKDGEMEETIRRFSCLPIRRLLLTKLDEASSFGNLFNQAVFAKKPLSYFTTGQKVPEDFEVASAERLIDLILRFSGPQGLQKEGKVYGSGRKPAFSEH
ncbi:MAG TPA: flagellar biosynthesis protein FlhF [bacterium]|nr:flagellar biosynthesis protein FlhF [bacterium]